MLRTVAVCASRERDLYQPDPVAPLRLTGNRAERRVTAQVRRRLSTACATCLALAVLHGGSAVMAQTVIRITTAGGAIFAASPPGDTSRLFIAQQGSSGAADIKIVNLADNSTNATPFLHLTGIATGGEQGLLGMAFDPNYATNGRFYLDYTTPGGAFGNGVTHVARYQVSANPNVADAASGTDIITIDQPQTNHNGGWIGFSNRAGDANNLYVAMGDGGNGDDQGTGHIEPTGNAQDPHNLLGKMLRLDVGTPGPAAHPNYAIPANNPFANGVNGAPEVFLYGLRNPFRDSFDSQTGNLFMGDVGQDRREEIDVQKASNPGGGENYGWRLREGTIATPNVGGTAPGATEPILDYAHSTEDATHPAIGQAVIGGYVYHGVGVPSLQGKYVFGDLLGPEDNATNPSRLGRIFTLQYNGTTASNFTDITSQLFTATGFSLLHPHSFGVDGSGELYIIDSNGALYRIVAATVPGDANHDGIVNGQDLSLISSNWLSTAANLPADANHDGIVNGQDIGLVASHWLQSSGGGAGGAAAVPEPATFTLAGVAMVAYVTLRTRRRRRP